MDRASAFVERKKLPAARAGSSKAGYYGAMLLNWWPTLFRRVADGTTQEGEGPMATTAIKARSRAYSTRLAPVSSLLLTWSRPSRRSFPARALSG